MKKVFLMLSFLGMITLTNVASATLIEFQGSGAMLWDQSTGVVSSNPASAGLEYLTDSGTTLLGSSGGFDSFTLAVGESLHFWFTDTNLSIVNLYGEITSLVTANVGFPTGSFSFFGAGSTGEIFEINGSQAFNNLGQSISQSISNSGQYTASVPVSGTLALLGIGLAGLGWSSRKKSAS